MDIEEKRWLNAQIRLAKFYGQNFNLYRPNYNQVDNTPALLGNIRLKVEKTGPRLHQGEFARLEYYALFGNYTRLQTGDVLVCTSPRSTTPVITVDTYSRFEETMGFRTSRSCSIYQSMMDSPVYTNVKFEWVSDSGFPGSALPEALAANLSIPTRKAILYTRPNLKPESYLGGDVQGMHLVEDGGSAIPWTIKLVECIGSLTQLIVQRV